MTQILIPEIRTLLSQKKFLDQQPYCVETSRNNEGPIDPAAEEEP